MEKITYGEEIEKDSDKRSKENTKALHQTSSFSSSSLVSYNFFWIVFVPRMF